MNYELMILKVAKPDRRKKINRVEIRDDNGNIKPTGKILRVLISPDPKVKRDDEWSYTLNDGQLGSVLSNGYNILILNGNINEMIQFEAIDPGGEGKLRGNFKENVRDIIGHEDPIKYSELSKLMEKGYSLLVTPVAKSDVKS